MTTVEHRPPTKEDPWERHMQCGLSYGRDTTFCVTVQGGVQFNGLYHQAFSNTEIIQLNEEGEASDVVDGESFLPMVRVPTRIHVIQRSAIIAVTCAISVVRQKRYNE